MNPYLATAILVFSCVICYCAGVYTTAMTINVSIQQAKAEQDSEEVKMPAKFRLGPLPNSSPGRKQAVARWEI